MNSAYNFNLYVKDTFLGSLEWPLYKGLTVIIYLDNNYGHNEEDGEYMYKVRH
jgi:hypothetical protein